MLSQRNLIGIIVALIFLAACRKEKITTANYATNAPPAGNNTTPITVPCGTRPRVQATLVPIGSLSSARMQILAASAANKIVFIGGYHEGQNWWYDPLPADVYDISKNAWTSYSLTANGQTNFRYGAAIASVGTKILFAGGGDPIGDIQTSVVNIYDASSESWSTAQLSVARAGLAAAAVGNKVLFAGGFGYPGGSDWGYFTRVDIYDDHDHSWSTATLSQARMDISGISAGNKVYFAGGRIDGTALKSIDIYDQTTGSWSVSSLEQPRTSMASIEGGGKIFWAGGAKVLGPEWSYNDNVEILDLSTGVTSLECMIPRLGFNAVKRGDDIIFFTGSDRDFGDEFEIYNTVADTWSTGVLDKTIQSAAIISVNNTIYVAGGLVNGKYSSQVWKLEF